MLKDDFLRLKHMLDAAKDAIAFANNRTRQELDNNRMLTLALLKSIEIIGEAAAKISPECRKNLEGIPWKNIIAMRNRLIHGYFDIDLDRVWDTVTADLPLLIASLEKIEGNEEKPK